MTVRETIIRLRTAHPEWPLREIAQVVSRTGERVRQVLAKANLPTKCVRPLGAAPHLCIKCQLVWLRKTLKYCSPCRPRAKKVWLTCSFCTVPFPLPERSYNERIGEGQRFFYHNRSCFYLGRKAGQSSYAYHKLG